MTLNSKTPNADAAPQDQIALRLDEKPITIRAFLSLARKQGSIPKLVQEWVLDQTLAETPLPETQQSALLDEFLKQQGLESDEAFQAFLINRHIDQTLLLQMISRPHQVVAYREERWGPAASSLYLQKKDQFDLVRYRRLQSSNSDVMQEIYFRLKDQEESWESLARQFPGAPTDATALVGPLAVAEVEQPILEVLRQLEPGKVGRPLQLNDQVVVVALEEFTPSALNQTIRDTLLRQAFEEWLQTECDRILNKISFPA
jgi:hypothetical protein